MRGLSREGTRCKRKTFADGLPLLFGATASDPDTQPYAYLNYLIFDEQFNSLDAGAMRVPTTAGFDPGFELMPHQEVKFQPVAISTTGFMYIWVSNESENTKVWFDDLTITHRQRIVTQATDYGPWGDIVREQKTNLLEQYRYGYQGQFAEKDEETGWNHFELREYDPVVGRWLVPDIERQYFSPYLTFGNNPINRVDPDGGMDGDPTDPKPTGKKDADGNSVFDLDEVTVTAPKMSQLEARNYDRIQRRGILEAGSFWNTNPSNVHYYQTQWARDFNSFAGAGANAISLAIAAPVLGVAAGNTISTSAVAYSAAAVEIDAISAYAYFTANNYITGKVTVVSLGLGKFGYELVRSKQIRLFRIQHRWSRSKFESVEKTMQNLNLMPSRLEQPFIPLDPTSGMPGFRDVRNLFKSTPPGID